MCRDCDPSRLMDGVDRLLYPHAAGDLPVNPQGYDVPLLGGDLLRGDDYYLAVVLQVGVRLELVVIGDGHTSDPVLDAAVYDLLRL